MAEAPWSVAAPWPKAPGVPETRERAPAIQKQAPLWEAGSGLLCHAVAGIVPSALTALTAVFGIGMSVAPWR